MLLTKDEVLERVNKLAEDNYKVRMLLEVNGGYDKVPEFQKNLINKEIGVKLEVIVTEEFTTVDN